MKQYILKPHGVNATQTPMHNKFIEFTDYDPVEVIEYGRELFLDQNDMFRHGIFSDIFKRRCFSAIKYVWEAMISSRFEDRRINRFYNHFNTDRIHWIAICSDCLCCYPEVVTPAHQWLQDNNIEHIAMRKLSQNIDYIYFPNPEDAVLFYMTWITYD